MIKSLTIIGYIEQTDRFQIPVDNMFIGQPVDLEADHEEFCQVDLVKCERHDLQGGFHPLAPEVPVQVDDIVELFHLEGLEQGVHVTIKGMDLSDVRIFTEQGQKLLFGQEMHLCPVYLLLQATYYRRCQDNITDGTKTYDEVFDQTPGYLFRLLINCNKASQYSSLEGLSSQSARAP